jgi:tRNA modification GTPase
MTINSMFDTIAAISTPVGEGGIGIIRISGASALPLARKIFRLSASGLAPQIHSHHIHHGWVLDPVTGVLVDEALLVYMAAPKSYTREDVVEINCHSGYAVLNRILGIVLQCGARLAEPGEFTRRAFLNGRIDLSQAEAVIETIRSTSESSLAAANKRLHGDFGGKVKEWRERILQLEAEIGASLDFPEETEEEPLGRDADLAHRLHKGLLDPIARILAAYEGGRILREGLTLVLLGKPNVGKSSLLNALLGKDRAIVTPIPGTTRDVIEDSFTISGALVKILDTAGIRGEADIIESMGIERSLRAMDDADAVLWLIDGSAPITEGDDLVLQAMENRRAELPRIILVNKADLPQATPLGEVKKRYGEAFPLESICALNPSHIDRVRRLLYDLFLKRPMEASTAAIAINLRHRNHLTLAFETLQRANELLTHPGAPIELVGMELQTARAEMDVILGCGVADDLLDRIFAEFCIGK